MSRRLLGFGTYDTDQHPRVKVLLEGMAANGWSVTELDRPLGLSTSERVRMLRQPWRLPLLAARMASRWAGLVAGRLRFTGLRRPDAVLVGYMGHFDVLLARVLFPRTPIVLDHLIFAAGTAKDRGESGGAKLALLRLLDGLATRAADVIVVDTEEHAEMLAPAVAGRGVVVPVGAPAGWYAAGRSAAAGSEGGEGAIEHAEEDGAAQLSIVFFGLFTPLQGAPAIARALRSLHERSVPFRATLIGGGQDEDECREILSGVDDVEWVEWVPGAELPAVVAGYDVCLGIMGTTDKARNVVPNKVYQGLAAGCTVVTSDTPPQRRLLDDAAVLVPAGDGEALADALQTLAGGPEDLADARRRAREAAGRFDAPHVVAPLVSEMDGVR